MSETDITINDNVLNVKCMRKKGTVLFNNVFNTFYLWLYGVGC